MTETQYIGLFIGAISVMATALGVLWKYFVRINQERREDTKTMTIALQNSTNVVEDSANRFEKTFKLTAKELRETRKAGVENTQKIMLALPKKK